MAGAANRTIEAAWLPGPIAPREVAIEVVGSSLAGFDILRAESYEEGYRFLEAFTFGRNNGIVLAACLAGALMGIGGLADAVLPDDQQRLWGLYVRPALRRRGVGRALVAALLDRGEHGGRAVKASAGTTAASSFWQALGFTPEPRYGHTHVLYPSAQGVRQ